MAHMAGGQGSWQLGLHDTSNSRRQGSTHATQGGSHLLGKMNASVSPSSTTDGDKSSVPWHDWRVLVPAAVGVVGVAAAAVWFLPWPSTTDPRRLGTPPSPFAYISRLHNIIQYHCIVIGIAEKRACS